LVAPTTQLLARPDLHPALINLLLEAAMVVHEIGGEFEREGEFPTPKYLDFKLSPEAARFYKNGPPFLQRYLPAQPGEIVDPAGTSIGRHEGLMYYTLGQRQGLGIGGRQDADEAPWYVVDKDLQTNRLIAAQGHDHPLLMKNSLLAAQMHWVAGHEPGLPLACHARIRHRQTLQACEITQQTDGHCQVRFDQPQRAVTPGQSIVFYQARECLGGGIIESAFNTA